jgi:hypothetical protein
MSETLQSPSPIPNLPDWYQFPLLGWQMSLDYQRALAFVQEDDESRPLLLTKAGAVKLLEPTEPIVSLFPHPLGGFCALSPDTFYLLDQEGAVLKVHTLRERKDKENERVSGYPYEMHFDRGLMIVGYAKPDQSEVFTLQGEHIGTVDGRAIRALPIQPPGEHWVIVRPIGGESSLHEAQTRQVRPFPKLKNSSFLWYQPMSINAFICINDTHPAVWNWEGKETARREDLSCITKLPGVRQGQELLFCITAEAILVLDQKLETLETHPGNFSRILGGSIIDERILLYSSRQVYFYDLYGQLEKSFLLPVGQYGFGYLQEVKQIGTEVYSCELFYKPQMVLKEAMDFILHTDTEEVEPLSKRGGSCTDWFSGQEGEFLYLYSPTPKLADSLYHGNHIQALNRLKKELKQRSLAKILRPQQSVSKPKVPRNRSFYGTTAFSSCLPAWEAMGEPQESLWPLPDDHGDLLVQWQEFQHGYYHAFLCSFIYLGEVIKFTEAFKKNEWGRDSDKVTEHTGLDRTQIAVSGGFAQYKTQSPDLSLQDGLIILHLDTSESASHSHHMIIKSIVTDLQIDLAIRRGYAETVQTFSE